MKPIAAAIQVVPRAKVTTRLQLHAGTVSELFSALRDGGRWWLVPMIAILGLSALLLVAVAALEYVAPFVYTIF